MNEKFINYCPFFMEKYDIDLENPELLGSLERIKKTQSSFIREYAEQNKDMQREEKSYDAYFSDSWETDIKKQREAANLPVSDVARFASIVDTISGNERQNRSDVSVFPFENDDQQTADVANLYLKYRNRKESQWHEDSLAFINAIISKRAHYEYFLRNNPHDGSLETVRILRPASEVLVQKPFREITARDSKGTFHFQWVYVDDLKNQYKGKIPVEMLDYTPRERRPKTEITHLLDAYDFPDDQPDNRSMFYDGNRRMVRVIRHWRRYKKSIYRVLNPSPINFNDILVTTEDSRRDALFAASNMLAERPELALEIIQNTRIAVDGERITEVTNRNVEIVAAEMIEEQFKDVYSYQAISGRVELEHKDEWGDFLPWTHLFCYFADGKAGGLYDRIKDLIQEVNFIHAKLMQRLGTMGKMPIVMEEGVTKMKDDAVRQAFEDGGVIWVEEGAIGSRRYDVLEDKTLNSIPPYLTLEESLNNTMKELTGANDPLQGRSPGANTAGIAIELLQRSGTALIAPMQDNFKRFKMENSRMEILMLVRAYELRPNWTSMKMLRVVGGMIQGDQSQFQKLQQVLQETDELTKDGDEQGMIVLMSRILKRMRSMEYDFTMEETVQSPTIRMMTLQMLANTARTLGFAIPPNTIINMTELPQKVKDEMVRFAGSPEGQQQVEARMAEGGSNTNGTLEGFGTQ